jgi:hypothetical protein
MFFVRFLNTRITIFAYVALSTSRRGLAIDATQDIFLQLSKNGLGANFGVYW